MGKFLHAGNFLDGLETTGIEDVLDYIELEGAGAVPTPATGKGFIYLDPEAFVIKVVEGTSDPVNLLGVGAEANLNGSGATDRIAYWSDAHTLAAVAAIAQGLVLFADEDGLPTGDVNLTWDALNSALTTIPLPEGAFSAYTGAYRIGSAYGSNGHLEIGETGWGAFAFHAITDEGFGLNAVLVSDQQVSLVSDAAGNFWEWAVDRITGAWVSYATLDVGSQTLPVGSVYANISVAVGTASMDAGLESLLYGSAAANAEQTYTTLFRRVLPGTVVIQTGGDPQPTVTDDGAGNLVGAIGTGGTNTVDYDTGEISVSFDVDNGGLTTITYAFLPPGVLAEHYTLQVGGAFEFAGSNGARLEWDINQLRLAGIPNITTLGGYAIRYWNQSETDYADVVVGQPSALTFGVVAGPDYSGGYVNIGIGSQLATDIGSSTILYADGAVLALYDSDSGGGLMDKIVIPGGDNDTDLGAVNIFGGQDYRFRTGHFGTSVVVGVGLQEIQGEILKAGDTAANVAFVSYTYVSLPGIVPGTLTITDSSDPIQIITDDGVGGFLGDFGSTGGYLDYASGSLVDVSFAGNSTGPVTVAYTSTMIGRGVFGNGVITDEVRSLGNGLALRANFVNLAADEVQIHAGAYGMSVFSGADISLVAAVGIGLHVGSAFVVLDPDGFFGSGTLGKEEARWGGIFADLPDEDPGVVGEFWANGNVVCRSNPSSPTVYAPALDGATYGDAGVPVAYVPATVTIDMVLPNAGLTFTSKQEHNVGIGTSVQVLGGADSGSIVVTVPAPGGIIITPARTGGVITSTANDVKAAIDAEPDATALVSVAVEGTGLGVVDNGTGGQGTGPVFDLTGGHDATAAGAGEVRRGGGDLYVAIDDVAGTDNLDNWKRVVLEAV